MRKKIIILVVIIFAVSLCIIMIQQREAYFGSKYFAGISTSGGSGAKNIAKELVHFPKNGVFERGYISGTLGADLKGKNVSGIAMNQAKKLGEKLVLDIKESKKYTFQNMAGRLLSRFILRPGFKRFIIRDKDTKTQAVYENLKLRELI
jgi:hypothetical protein